MYIAGFLLFTVSIFVCLVRGIALMWALLLAFILFFGIGLAKGYKPDELRRMSAERLPGSLVVLRILALIGILMGLWRADGTIAYLIYYGVRLIHPQLFILITFVFSSFMSYLLGTSLGVASTAGLIFITLARSSGADTVITAGAIMSGIYFGDRCSPVSSSASLVAAVTGTELYDNVRKMLLSAAVPTVVSAMLYAFLSVRHPMGEPGEEMLAVLSESFSLTPAVLIPALLMFVLPILKVSIIKSVSISAAAAFAVSVLVQGQTLQEVCASAVFGYHPANAELAGIMSGGGLISMAKVMIMIILAALYTGILNGTGAMDRTEEALEALSGRCGRFAVMIIVSVVSAMLFCNQTIVIMMDSQLMSRLYGDTAEERSALAIDIENSGVVIAALIPWTVACATPLAALDAGADSLPYAFLLYLIPLYWLLRSGFRAKTAGRWGWFQSDHIYQ